MAKQRGMLLSSVLIIYTIFIVQQIIRDAVAITGSGLTSADMAAAAVLVINLAVACGLWFWKRIAVYGLFGSWIIIVLLYVGYVYSKFVSSGADYEYSSHTAQGLANRMHAIILLSSLLPVVMWLLVLLVFLVAVKRKWQYFE